MEFVGQEEGRAAALGRLTAWSAKWSCAHAKILLWVMLLLTVGAGWYAATHLSIDTRTDRLLDPNLLWRVEEKALNDAFPQNNRVLAIVLDAASPEIADAAAVKLVAELAKHPSEFQSINDPAGAEFLRRNGLLFLDKTEVRTVTEQLIGAQGLLGTLVTDPTLNGLFTALNLTLDGVARGQIEAGAVEKPLAAIADTLAARESGTPAILSWRKTLTGLDPQPIELLRVITVRPALDFTSITPGEKASNDIRAMAEGLGLTPQNGVHLRLTGDVALDDEEFSSIEAGMGFATVLSMVIVLFILYLAVHALRAIAAIVITLLMGLVFTLAFATLAVGSLNLVSVAFVVMFIGIAVDFGIQYCVRFRDESVGAQDVDHAARKTGRTIGGALLLAAVTTSVGFLAFLPTGYKGVSELGMVAGIGMLIAFMLNVTLLPALLSLFNWRPRKRKNSLFSSEGPDRFIVRNKNRILIGAFVLMIGAFAVLPRLTFDFDPINLKDPNAESVRTLRALEKAGAPSTNVMEVLTRDRAGLPNLAQKLEALPEVASVMSILTFVPADQDEKIKMIQDAAGLILPAYDLAGLVPEASDEATLATMRVTTQRLHDLKDKAPSFERLAGVLDRVLTPAAPDLAGLKGALLTGLDVMLSNLALMLQPNGIREAELPAGFKADWLSPDGQYRIEVVPKGDHGDPGQLSRFIAAVRAVAPGGVGPAYFIQEAGHVVWQAFRSAFLYAFLGVLLILGLVLGRALDVALVVGPLLFSAITTLALTILIGLPVNFANVIALPLLMGVGVAFNIYFVSNWRAGQTALLRSSTARAVVLSALTTLTAFGSLALSPHAGTASMGLLLTLCLGITLVTALILLPALLARLRPQAQD